ncbi:MAG: tetratricopeptide repeat protein [Devosiaceae bacterium]
MRASRGGIVGEILMHFFGKFAFCKLKVSSWLTPLLMGAVLALAGNTLSASPSLAQSTQANVAYQAVLANPDSLETNSALLRAQLADADFQAASATLQRILLINPNFDRARLIRVAVFLRLGDNAGALEDLAFLSERPLSPEDQAEASRLAGMVRASPVSPRVSGVVRLGAMYDTNPALAPGAGTTDAGVPFNAPSNDEAFGFGEVQLRGEVPFGNGLGHSLRAQVSGFARLRDDGNSDTASGRLAVGPRLDLGFAFVDVMAVAGTQFSNGHLYGHHVGGAVQLTADVSDVLTATARVEAVHEALDVNLFSTTNLGDADGLRVSVRPELTYRLSGAVALSVHGSYVHKDAGSAWYGYNGFGGGASLRFRNASGVSMRVGGSVRQLAYDAANPNSAVALAREDTRYSLSGGLAVPVALLVESIDEGADASWARGWAVETFGRYTVIQSNSALFEADNFSFGLSFARQFSM